MVMPTLHCYKTIFNRISPFSTAYTYFSTAYPQFYQKVFGGLKYFY